VFLFEPEGGGSQLTTYTGYTLKVDAASFSEMSVIDSVSDMSLAANCNSRGN